MTTAIDHAIDHAEAFVETRDVTRVVSIAPREKREPVSPFVGWSEADRGELPEALDARAEGSLPVEVLCDPDAIVARLLDPARLQTTVLGALAIIVVATGFFAGTVMAARPGTDALRAAVGVPVNALIALAAALGPIYATGLLVAARLPLSRLVATMLSACATGALILAALAPIPYGLFKLDAEWAGPLAMFGAFAISAVASGGRLHRLLHTLAEQVLRIVRDDDEAQLTDGDRFRVGILARMSMVFIAFTLSLSVWIFDVLT